MDIEVRNNEAHQRYEICADGWVVGVAEYRLIDGTVVFTHTEVEEQLRTKGHARRLVEFALEDVRKSGRKVIPRCEFVRRFIADHPQFGDLLAA